MPLKMQKMCEEQPCPVNCKLAEWSEWSKCSADCGGGVRQKMREVIRAEAHEGKPCGQTSKTESCNMGSCEKDCELSDWSIWSTCSKDCDGGTMKRMKYIKSKPEGKGKCPDAWSVKRLNFKPCNTQVCQVTPAQMATHCTQEEDIVLLIDGSGSLGKSGWDAEIKAATKFVEGFKSASAKAAFSIIVYSGPYWWWRVYSCIYWSRYVDTERVCKIKKVLDFSTNYDTVLAKIKAQRWPGGTTLTSLALGVAKAELSLGRKDAKSNVIVFTDGRPMSTRHTWLAARDLRKAARLMWVPVTRYAPLKQIKWWATRRWQENVVVVKEFKDLDKDEKIVQIIANMCPKVAPRVQYAAFR